MYNTQTKELVKIWVDASGGVEDYVYRDNEGTPWQYAWLKSVVGKRIKDLED